MNVLLLLLCVLHGLLLLLLQCLPLLVLLHAGHAAVL
jgi:hypothetical protein